MRLLRPIIIFLPALSLLLIASTAVVAHGANMTVPGGRLALANQAAAATQFEPAACNGSVTSIVVVPGGGGPFTVSTANALIIGTSGNDNVRATNGYACFVGGGPTSSNKDKFTGQAGAGDECVVATSDPASNISRCTIVQRAP
jgi:hypothetical protein